MAGPTVGGWMNRAQDAGAKAQQQVQWLCACVAVGCCVRLSSAAPCFLVLANPQHPSPCSAAHV